MKKVLLTMFLCLVPVMSFAWTAAITFTEPADSNYVTDVLVSEISGDYTESYGQRSEPGADNVEIGNIKPSTTYYFMAYRLDPATWIKSANSEEVSYTTSAYAEPIIKELPPVMVGGDTFVITIEVNP